MAEVGISVVVKPVFIGRGLGPGYAGKRPILGLQHFNGLGNVIRYEAEKLQQTGRQIH